MSTKVRRLVLKGELRRRVEEQVLHWVRAHPGHQVDCMGIAHALGVSAQQVSTCVRGLHKTGEIERLSRFTYKIPEPDSGNLTLLPTEPSPEPEPLYPPQIDSSIEVLCQKFFWHNPKADKQTLDDLISWSKKENN